MTGFYNSIKGSVTGALMHHLLTNPASSTTAPGTPVLLHTPQPSAPPPSVAVVSFGGSGHEPFSAGFLGDGFLSAAVPGAVFASPPAAHVATAFAAAAAASPSVAAIVAIVLNYQGDRLSYQRAVERYTAEDPDALPVYEIVIADDVSIPDARRPRGLAGAVLVAKIVGAASAAGMSVVDIVEVAKSAAASVVTIGAALSRATLPGAPRARPDEMDDGGSRVSIGLGIHNEPGYETLPFGSSTPGHEESLARDVVLEVCQRLEDALAENGDALGAPGMVVLVNNLGGVSQLGLSVLQECVADFVFGTEGRSFSSYSSENLLRCVDEDTRVYLCSGTLVSSLDMNGFSVSAMPLSSTMEALLLAETTAPAWPRVVRVTRAMYQTCAIESGLRQAPFTVDTKGPSGEATKAVSQGKDPTRPGLIHSTPLPSKDACDATSQEVVRICKNTRTIEYIAKALLEKADELGELDRHVGDGDFGQTLASGCQALRKAISEGRLARLDSAAICGTLAELLGTEVGGTSGAMAVVFFEALHSHMKSKQETVTAVESEFQNGPSPPPTTSEPRTTQCSTGSKKVASGGDSPPTWRSALLAGSAAISMAGGAKVGDRTLIDALEPAAKAAVRGESPAGVAKIATAAAAATSKIDVAKRGRSSSVASDRLLGRPDPGAVAVSVALQAWADCKDDDE